MAVASVLGADRACIMQHGVIRASQAGCESAPSRSSMTMHNQRPNLQRCPFTPTAHQSPQPRSHSGQWNVQARCFSRALLKPPRSRESIRATSKSFSSPSDLKLRQPLSRKEQRLQRVSVESSLTTGDFRHSLKQTVALRSRHSVRSRGVVASRLASIVSSREGVLRSRSAFWESLLPHSRGTQTGRRKGGGSALACTCSADLASGMFTFGTAMVVPFYTLMLAAPTWRVTRKVMDSAIPYVVLGAMYMYLLFISWTPEHPKLMFSSKYWLPELPGITRMFSSMLTVSSAWIHLLAVDLFAGRNIYLDSITHNLPCRHSLVLCLMFGPVGIFSHLFTKIWLAPPWPFKRGPVDVCKRRQAPRTS